MCCSLPIEPFKILNGLNQNHTEANCTESRKDIKSLGAFNDYQLYHKHQHAKHSRCIAENGNEDTLATFSLDELAFIFEPLSHAIQLDVREYPKRAIQSEEQEYEGANGS